MNDDLKATHSDLLNQARGIADLPYSVYDIERAGLHAQAEELVTKLEAMKL